MDQHQKQNNTIFSQISCSTKALQILLSLSVLAIIASQYSSLLSYFSSFKLLSYCTTDRHYIFLICNGLMLLVIKTSGLFASPTPPGSEFYRDGHVIRHHVLQEDIHAKNNNVMLQTDHLPEAKAETDTRVVDEIDETIIEITELDQGGECVTSAADYDEKEVISDLLDEQQEHEEAEEEEQEIMLWSTEELNKKCDDFIRKIKYGIKNEASLIMV